MPARLIEALANTKPLSDIFSDDSVLRALLRFEAALATAEARVGVIPRSAAQAIVAATRSEQFEVSEIVHATLRAGTPGIPIVKALTEAVCRQNSAAAGFVHWGATSQDVADTALVLLLKQAQLVIIRDLDELETALRSLSEKHKNTIMLGRTLLQGAPPITFGLKVAGWFAAIQRSRLQLEEAFAAALIVQFGGASGTLAALSKKGTVVARALAEELGLGHPEAPWHTQRDRLASLVCACGVLTGTLGKMAQDIALMMQNEVAEVSEPGGDGRGGSSTMPHKRNPIACAITRAAAIRVPHLVAAYLSSMSQEHERGVGGWQAEWPIIASTIQSTGLAVFSLAEVARGLSVDVKRMRENLDATKGLIFGERAMMLLAPKIGRDSAHQLLELAAKKSAREGLRLGEVLEGMPEVTEHLSARVLQHLEAPEEYLGSADQFRQAQVGRGPRTKSAQSRARTRRRKER